MGDWFLAIDFGTSNTTAATLEPDGTTVVLEVDNTKYLPSVVYRDNEGRLHVGKIAVDRMFAYPERIERIPKRALVDHREVVLDGTAVLTVDLVAALLGRMYTEAVRRHDNLPPSAVVLTHPARWTSYETDRLCEAAARAGIHRPWLIEEPVAAATWYADNGDAQLGGHIAVFDFGGGTLDTAVLHRGADGFRLVGAPGGDAHLGGEDLDEDLKALVGGHAALMHPERWTAFNADTVEAARDRLQLRREVTTAKEALSEHGSHELLVPGFDEEIRVTRHEFVTAVDRRLRHGVDELFRTVSAAGLDRTDLDALYLTGGSSRIPAVSERFAEVLGYLPKVHGDPKAVVALGALQAYRKDPAARSRGDASAVRRTPRREPLTERTEVRPRSDETLPPRARAEKRSYLGGAVFVFLTLFIIAVLTASLVGETAGGWILIAALVVSVLYPSLRRFFASPAPTRRPPAERK